MKKSTTEKASKAIKKHKVKEISSSQIRESKEITIIDSVKVVPKSKSSDQTETNEFCRMRDEIKSRIDEYNRIRKECGITDSANSATIERLAKPFLNDCFTLAVVGKTSAGKSTFINAFIGEDLLPTNFLQTTCASTYIESGIEKRMEIEFYDKKCKPQIYIGDDIKKELKQHVAIPKEYENLPINAINELIIKGANIEDILEQKELLENDHPGLIIENEDKWRNYVNTHPKKTIARKVKVTFPLPKEFEGWRIIDTPGIGTSGGLDDETLKLLLSRSDGKNKDVDAVIFLHSGIDNIQDTTSRKFLDEVCQGFLDDTKKRSFFVLTKSSKDDFRNNKPEIMEQAVRYAKQLGISEERVTYIDSVLYKFYKDLKGKDKANPQNIVLPDWNEKELKEMKTLLRGAIEIEREDRGLEPDCDESYDLIMSEWANFDNFKKIINEFASKEKKNDFDEIIRLIDKDCSFFFDDFQNKLDILEGKTSIDEKYEKLKEEKITYSKALASIQQELNRDITPDFEPIYENCKKEVNDAKTETFVTTSYCNFIDKIRDKELEITENTKNKFEQCVGDSFFDDKKRSIMIDYDAVDKKLDEEEKEAKANSKRWVDDTSATPEIKRRKIKRGDRFIDKVLDCIKPNYKEIKKYPKIQKPIPELFLSGYKNLVEKKANIIFKNKIKKITKRRVDLYKSLKEEVDKKLSLAEEELLKLSKELDDTKNAIERYKRYLNIIQESEYYGQAAK